MAKRDFTIRKIGERTDQNALGKCFAPGRVQENETENEDSEEADQPV